MSPFGNPSGKSAKFSERGPSSSSKGPSSDAKFRARADQRASQREKLLAYQRLQAKADKSQHENDVADLVAADFYLHFGKKDIDRSFFDVTDDYSVPASVVLSALNKRHPQFQRLHSDDIDTIREHIDEDD